MFINIVLGSLLKLYLDLFVRLTKIKLAFGTVDKNMDCILLV